MSNWFTNLFSSATTVAAVAAPALPAPQAAAVQAALAALGALNNSATVSTTVAVPQTTSSIQPPTDMQILTAQQALTTAQTNYNNLMAQKKAFDAYNAALKVALNPPV